MPCEKRRCPAEKTTVFRQKLVCETGQGKHTNIFLAFEADTAESPTFTCSTSA
jgi:hypothetical protein